MRKTSLSPQEELERLVLENSSNQEMMEWIQVGSSAPQHLHPHGKDVQMLDNTQSLIVSFFSSTSMEDRGRPRRSSLRWWPQSVELCKFDWRHEESRWLWFWFWFKPPSVPSRCHFDKEKLKVWSLASWLVVACDEESLWGGSHAVNHQLLV